MLSDDEYWEREIKRRDFTTKLGIGGILFILGCGGYTILNPLKIDRKLRPKTIAHDLLRLEYEIGNEFEKETNVEIRVSNKESERLEDIIDNSIRNIGKITLSNGQLEKKEAIRIAKKIFQTTKEDYHFNKTNLFSKALMTKQLDCFIGSILYASIGETLNLPIGIVIAPDHSFVRFNLKDNKTLNWEIEGYETQDSDYIYAANIPKELINNIYLKTLDVKKDKKTILGIQMAEMGLYYMKNDEIKTAKILFERSKNSLIIQSHLYSGIIAESEENYEEAIEHYTKIIELDRNHIKSTYGLGEILYKQCKINEALYWFERTVEIWKQAIEMYKKANKTPYPNPIEDQVYRKAIANLKDMYSKVGDTKNYLKYSLELTKLNLKLNFKQRTEPFVKECY